MKPVLLVFTLLLSAFLASAQPIPIEIMAGNRNAWYQHVLSRPFSQQSHWGYFHTSSLHAFYDHTPDELMSQSYLTYSVTPWMKGAVGSFYATAPGFKPSAALQFAKRGNHYFLLAVPRIDLITSPSYDMMVMFEYTPHITPGLSFYSRTQIMENYTGTTHNRSYQNIRLGLSVKGIQTGVAANFDAYGPNKNYYSNIGLFIKKDLF